MLHKLLQCSWSFRGCRDQMHNKANRLVNGLDITRANGLLLLHGFLNRILLHTFTCTYSFTCHASDHFISDLFVVWCGTFSTSADANKRGSL